MEVNAKLYDFLKENETGLYLKDKEVIAFVHVYFFNLEDFTEIIGSYWFDEGGMEVHLFNDTVCIELNDIIESGGHSLLSYKSCFSEYDIKCYEKELLAMS